MRFSIIACVILFMTLLTSCGSKYDQKVVDGLEKTIENNIDNDHFGLTEKDYSEMIKQANYALDDAEAADNYEKWRSENEKEAQSMIGLVFCLNGFMEENSNFPNSLKSEVKTLTKRFDKLSEKMYPETNSSKFDNSSSYDD